MRSTSTRPAKSRVGARAPRAGIRKRLLGAAAGILAAEGHAGLTMERVAATSGIAKTSLYRRWPTKAALCMELYMSVAGRELHDPDTGNVFDDLRRIAETVIRIQTRTVAGQAFVGMITAAHSRTETPAGFKDFAQRRREITRKVLERSLARGELRAGTDVDLVIDALGGAITFRLLQRHAPLNARFASDLVRLVLSGCAKSSLSLSVAA